MPLAVPVAVALTAGTITAAAADQTGIPSYGYGAVGALAVALLGFALRAYMREVKSGDAARAEVARLNTYIQEQVVPVVRVALDAVAENTRVIADDRAERDAYWRAQMAPRARRTSK